MPRFPTTHWSLIGAAGQADPAQRREVLGELLTRYLPALKAHLVYQKRLEPEDADDLLQGFVSRKLLEQDILTQVAPGKGKFRTWLLTVLDRFLVSERRYAAAAKRSAAGTVSLEEVRREQAAATPPPAAVFDQTWAREVLAEALRRLETECTATGRPDLWGVFQARVLGPTLEGSEPLPYEQLVERFAFASPVQASNALITAKRTFVRLLRAVIGEYSADEADVEDEIRDLQRILAGGAG